MPQDNHNLTIHTTLKSAPGRKVLALCYHLGLEPQVDWVDVYAGEGANPAYRAVNPFGKIPTLVHGAHVVWESNAILMYLAEVLGDYSLSSRDPARRAELLRDMFWESAHLMPSFAPVLTEFVATSLQDGREAADPNRIQWEQDPFWGHCRFLDDRLRAQAFVAGDALSVVDFAVAGMFTYAAASRFPFERLPALARWHEQVFSLDGFVRTEHPLWAT